MWYIGGKTRQAKHIANIVSQLIEEGQTYIEPFCGAMGSATKIIETINPDKIELSDINVSLICMWNNLMDGWIPVDRITRNEYAHFKSIQDENDPMTAYVGHSCSFGGKWYGGYVNPDKYKTSHMSLLKRVGILKSHCDVNISVKDYKDYENYENCMFYLDPPYIGRTKQSKFDFDYDIFWDFTRKLSENNTVIISEFVAPDDFVKIYSFGDTVVRHLNSKGKDGTDEGLYTWKNQ